MHPDVGKALHLQELDRTISDLRREIASLPKHIAEIEKALGSHLKKLEVDKGVLAANQHDRSKLEGEGKDNQQKISKLKDQMLGAKTNEQYRAFQKEIDYCETEIRKFDDRGLQLMEEADALSKNVSADELALSEEKRGVGERKKEVAAQSDRAKAELARFLAERAALTASISKPLLATYERLYKRMHDGRVVAKVMDSTCLGCNMTIRPQYLADLRLGSEVLACENCRRILFIEARPVDVEAQMNG
jgi:predicted  nucleic acid-binding Zn-ribbon protein